MMVTDIKKQWTIMILTPSYPRSAITHLNCNFIHKMKYLSYLSHKFVVIAKWDNLSKNVLKALGYHTNTYNCIYSTWELMHSTNNHWVPYSVPGIDVGDMAST